VQDGFKRVYRAVSEAEYQQIMQTGTFEPSPGNGYIMGKWFSDTVDSVNAHAAGLFPDGNFRIMEADIPVNAPSLYSHPNLDGRGPATFIGMDDLQGVNPRPFK
jgi:hypothetical protein